MTGRPVFDAEHEAFRDGVDRFLRAEHPTTDSAVTLAALHAAGTGGFLGIGGPESCGGSGLDDPRFTAVFGEQAMAVGGTGLAVRFGMQAALAVPVLGRHLNAGQARRLLPGLCSGERTVTVAGLGVDAQISAATDDRGLAVSGTDMDVPGAGTADMSLVVATTDDGPAVFVCDLTAVERTPVPDALGPVGVDGADLRFDLRVEHDQVLGGDQRQIANTLLADHDLWLATLSVAGGFSMLTQARHYVAERRVFGRRVADFENTRVILERVDTELSAARAVVDAALGRRAGGEVDPEGARQAAAHAVEAAACAADTGLQLHGGYGYMREYPIAQGFADARYLLLRAPHNDLELLSGG